MARSGGTTISRNLKDIEADIKACDKAFSSANKSAKSLQQSLKLDPQNTKLLGAYYDTVKDKIAACTDKIKLMKEEQAKLVQNNGGAAVQSQEYKKLDVEIEKTTVQIQAMNKELENSSNVTKKFGQLSVSNFIQVTTLVKGVQQAFKTITNTAKSLIGKVYELGEAFATTGDQIAKASQKYKVSTDTWQIQSYYWERLTGDASAYEAVLQAMTAVNGQAAVESSKLLKVLERLGLTFEDVQNMDPADALNVYLEALKGCEDEAERTALAVKLFGTNLGPWMAQMATVGSDSMEEWQKDLSGIGILTQDQIEKAEKLNDTIDNFKKSIQIMMAESGEQLEELLRSLLDLAKQLAPLFTGLAKALNAIGPAGAVAIGVFISIMSVLPTLIIMLNALNVAGKQYVSAIASLALLATVSGLGAAALVGLSSNLNKDVDGGYVGEYAQQDAIELSANSGNTTYNETNNSSSKVVNYEDNSQVTLNVNNEVDVDEVIEKITDKKRGMIGG